MENGSEPMLQQMVEYVSWLVETDYDILQFFGSHDIIISADDIARNIDRSDSNVRARLYRLSDARLVEQVDRSWRLTDYGRDYVNGDLQAEDLPDEPE
jgi:predicted transcriptional regulator